MKTITHSCSVSLYDYRAFIANEHFARSLIKKIRWPDGIECPHCDSNTIWNSQGDYRCGACDYHFSDISGTVFTKTHLPISKWILAIGLWKVNCNAKQVQWAIGVTYKVARSMLKKIRDVIQDDPFLAFLSGEIEVDETYYGGRQKGKRGRGAKNKIPVVGLKQRHGRVKTVVVPDVTRETLHAVIKKYVAPGSTVYTDGLPSYDTLEQKGYQHLPFDHSVHFVKSDLIHTQGIEGHWGITKPGTKARYRRITRQSLPGHMAENDFKHNNRTEPDFIRLVLAKLITLPV